MQQKVIIRTGLGQDSHRFTKEQTNGPCIMGGLEFTDAPAFDANSDGDVIYHALCNALTSLTGVVILGGIADDLCLNKGIKDSEMYLIKGLESLGDQQISHVAITIEAQRPKLRARYDALRHNIARVMDLNISQVGLTATSGEELTGFGRGEGVQCLAIITTVEEI